MGIIDALEVDAAIEKSMAEIVKIILNDMPAPFKKKTVKAIRSQGTISGQQLDDIVNLF